MNKIVHVSVGRLRTALEPGLPRTAESRLVVTAADGYAVQARTLDLDAYEDARKQAERLASSQPGHGARGGKAKRAHSGSAAPGARRPTKRGCEHTSPRSRNATARSKSSGAISRSFASRSRSA